MSRLEKWLAPSVLFGVALIQLTLAFSRDLSPWKGGGFGMFASVDAPSMRELDCTAVTENGKTIRIDALLLWDEDREDSQRAMPHQTALFHLAQRLLDSEFVPVGSRDEAVVAQMQADNPNLKLDLPPDSDRLYESGRYRPFRSSDLVAEKDVVRIKSVALRWWRVTYVHDEKLLRTEPIGEEVSLERPRDRE